MARTGLYKSDVKRARDSLLAQGANPSVDAVRVELGNTGSKTTIHKYLKELEEEGGAIDGRKASISEALQDLVARLARQLHDEASIRIDTIQARSSEKEMQHAEAMAALQKELNAMGEQFTRADAAAHQEATAHKVTREALQSETISRHILEQQVSDLKERLTENDAHRQSIEEKHQHARDALEHYRASVKEQRDQDQRRHEQQVQQLQAEMRQLQQNLIIKQNEVTRLNQEGARLVADLSHTQNALYDQQAHGRQLEQKLDTAQAVELQNTIIEAKLIQREAQIETQENQLDELTAKAERLSSELHSLKLTLAATNAALLERQTIAAELQAYLNSSNQTTKQKSI